MTDKPKCTANRHNGEPCGKWPMQGQKVCKIHGGASPQAIAAAQVRLLEQRALQALQVYGDQRRPIVNPFEELLDVASEVVAFKDAVASLVGRLGEQITQHIETSGKGDPDEDSDYIVVKFEEKIRPQIVLYERALDRCAKILAAIVSLGIEDRLARVTERQADTFARLIDGIVTDLGHNPTEPATAALIARRLELAQEGNQ